MEDIKKTFDDLFYKIAVIGRLNLSFIEDLNNFCNNFKNHKDFAEYKIKAKSTMSMIYYHHELLDKSFDLDFEFLQENPIKQPEYYVIIGRIVKASSVLMRTNEVKEYVNKFIIDEDVNNSLSKLPLLNWYAFHYPEEIVHNNTYDKVFSEIEQALGAPTYNDLPVAERVKTLADLNFHSARFVVYQFHMSYQQAAPELRPAILEEYINKTPLKYYQDIMKQAAEKYQ